MGVLLAGCARLRAAARVVPRLQVLPWELHLQPGATQTQPCLKTCPQLRLMPCCFTCLRRWCAMRASAACASSPRWTRRVGGCGRVPPCV